MSRKPDDWMDFIRRAARCCACGGSMGESPHCNLVAMGRRARWKYPVARNVLTGSEGEAVAVVCDGCVESKREIRWAVETEGDRVTYHLVNDLEPMPPEQTYRLIDLAQPGIPAELQVYPRKAILCLLCGRVSYNANDVRQLYCGACHVFHHRAEVGG